MHPTIRTVIAAVLGTGVLLGLIALQHNVEFQAVFLFAPVILFPYALLLLMSRAANARGMQVLFIASVVTLALSLLALSPNPDAQGGLIVLSIPLLQGVIAVGLYLVLRLTGSVRRQPPLPK